MKSSVSVPARALNPLPVASLIANPAIMSRYKSLLGIIPISGSLAFYN